MGVPVGIFQVVLIVGLIIHYYNRQIYSFLVQTLKKIGIRAFVFLVVVFFGLTSSIISVIVSAVILAEIALVMPLERKQKIEFVVIACFALGFGVGKGWCSTRTDIDGCLFRDNLPDVKNQIRISKYF